MAGKETVHTFSPLVRGWRNRVSKGGFEPARAILVGVLKRNNRHWLHARAPHGKPGVKNPDLLSKE